MKILNHGKTRKCDEEKPLCREKILLLFLKMIFSKECEFAKYSGGRRLSCILLVSNANSPDVVEEKGERQG